MDTIKSWLGEDKKILMHVSYVLLIFLSYIKSEESIYKA